MRKMRRPRGRRTPDKGKIGRHRGPEGFASKYEQKIYHSNRARGIRVSYEPITFYFDRRVRGSRCGDCGGRKIVRRSRYTPDFGLSGAIFIEAKGKFDAKARSRHEDFRQSRGDVELRFIFGADNWINKRHKRRYSDWCRERGIVHAFGTDIPEEWQTEAENLSRTGISPPALLEPPERD